MRERLVPIIIGVVAVALLGTLGFFGFRAIRNRTTTPVATGPTQIRIWRLEQDADPLRDSINEFLSNHQGVKVSYTRGKEATYEFDALKSLAARQGPEIWSIPNDWIADHEERIAPIPDAFFATEKNPKPDAATEIRNMYPAGIAEQLISPNNKVYGIPTNVDNLRVYWNPAYFELSLQDFAAATRASTGDDEAAFNAAYQPVRQLLSKPGATWDQVLQQVKYLTKRNGATFSRSAIAMGTADNVPNANEVLQLLIMQNGSEIVSANKKQPLFATQQTTPSGGVVRPGEKALEFYTSFADPTKENYSWNPSMPQAIDAFAQNKVGMVIAFTDFGLDLRVKYPNFSFETTSLPQISTTQDPVTLITFKVETVTRVASNSSLSLQLLKQYTNAGTIRDLASEANLRSPYTSALKDTDDTRSREILYGKAVYKRSRAQFDAAFRQAILDVSQNGATANGALAIASEKIDALLNPPQPTPTPNPN